MEDGQYIQTEIDGLRGAILCNVLVRVSDKYALEMHIDVEEANALGVKTATGPFSLTIEPGRRQGRGGQELTQANETLLEFERLIQTGGCNA